MQLDFLNYGTYYSCQHFDHGSLSKMDRHACWGALTSLMEFDNFQLENKPVKLQNFTWRIWKKQPERQNHYCFLNKDELIDYLNLLQVIFEFEKYTLIDTKEYYDIQMDFNIPYWNCRILLSFCRFTYELVNSYNLGVAYCLKKKGYFPELNPLQLTLLISNKFLLWHPDHAPYVQQKDLLVGYYSVEDFKKRLQNLPFNTRIQDFCPLINVTKIPNSEKIPIPSPRKINRDDISCLERESLPSSFIDTFTKLNKIIQKYTPPVTWNEFWKN